MLCGEPLVSRADYVIASSAMARCIGKRPGPVHRCCLIAHPEARRLIKMWFDARALRCRRDARSAVVSESDEYLLCHAGSTYRYIFAPRLIEFEILEEDLSALRRVTAERDASIQGEGDAFSVTTDAVTDNIQLVVKSCDGLVRMKDSMPLPMWTRFSTPLAAPVVSGPLR